MEIRTTAARFCSSIWYDYLYSDSKRSVILTLSAIAIFSSCFNVGDTLLFSILLRVDFPNPVFSANFINVNCFSVLFSHTVTFTLPTSFHYGSLQIDTNYIQNSRGEHLWMKKDLNLQALRIHAITPSFRIKAIKACMAVLAVKKSMQERDWKKEY